MKLFCISDDILIKNGMRLAGIEGDLLQPSKKELEDYIDNIIKNKEIAVVLITENLANLCEDRISKIKTTIKKPLIVTIPNRNSEFAITNKIKKYISESIGINI